MVALEPTAHGVRTARRFACNALHSHDVNIRDIVVLLVSELVSNAVQHGGPHEPAATVDLEVQASPGLVRVDVTDAGAGDPVVGNGAIDYASGRGLLLVGALASQWGCCRLPVGKTVWFEVLLPSGGEQDE